MDYKPPQKQQAEDGPLSPEAAQLFAAALQQGPPSVFAPQGTGINSPGQVKVSPWVNMVRNLQNFIK